MKINWKLRFQNFYFWLGLIGAVATPIFTYMGLTAADLTTWAALWDMIVAFVSNPYLIMTVGSSILTFLGLLNDPTVKGLSDSTRALSYPTLANSVKTKTDNK